MGKAQDKDNLFKKLSLEQPTQVLEFVLTNYKNTFTSFIKNGLTKEYDKSNMKRAIDLFIDFREMDKVTRQQAAAEINDSTQSGIQNLVVVMFFCETVKFK